jgi:hydrogenase maturation protease
LTAASTASESTSVRLLGLGNDILADDALGILVAQEAQRRYGPALDTVASSETGFNLLDQLLGVSRLVVVDAIQSGAAPPGAIQIFDSEDLRAAPGGSPHFIGLFEVLEVARALGLNAPRQVTIVAVEAADCTTVGGPMHPAVQAAIPLIAKWAGQFRKGT